MLANESVTSLLDALCRSLVRDFGQRDNDLDGVDTKFLRRCRSLAYAVLLKKAPSTVMNADNDDWRPIDPIARLRYCQFECDLQMGMAKSIEFGVYGPLNAHSIFIRQLRDHRALIQRTLNYLETADEDDLVNQPIVSMLMNLVNLATLRSEQREVTYIYIRHGEKESELYICVEENPAKKSGAKK